jgi:hypothetical protein
MRAHASEHELVAVGIRLGHAIGADHAARSPDVNDDHLLAEHFAHALRHDTADAVLWPAGRERDHHRDRSRRPFLRLSRACPRQEARNCNTDCRFRHSFLPRNGDFLASPARTVKPGF